MEDEVKEFIKDILRRLKAREEGAASSADKTETEVRHVSRYISPAEILLDLKILSDGIFDAELYDNGDSLELDFPNGQNFLIKVEEVRD